MSVLHIYYILVLYTILLTFFIAVTNEMTKRNFWKEGFILIYSLRRYSLPWQERHSRSRRPADSLYLQSQSRMTRTQVKL